MLRIDATGDLTRATGRMQQLSETADRAQAIGQRIQIRLSRWRGEWAYDTRLGIPWSDLLGKGVTDAQLRARISSEILKVPGVESLPALTLTRADRTLDVACRVQLVGADTPVIFSVSIAI